MRFFKLIGGLYGDVGGGADNELVGGMRNMCGIHEETYRNRLIPK